MLLLLVTACSKNDQPVIEASGEDLGLVTNDHTLDGFVYFNYESTMPSYLIRLGMKAQKPDNFKANLGRVLFYDKNLSKDRSVSCASCHKARYAFSDNVAFSTGIEGRLTARNSMPLGNVANFSAHYSTINGKTPMLFWDERAKDVPGQSRQTFGNPQEMGMTMEEVVARVKAQTYYSDIWEKAYDDFEPTGDKILACLNEFVGAMSCFDTKLDRAMEHTAGDLSQSGASIDTLIFKDYSSTDTTVIINTIFSPSEDRGRIIFVTNCTKCHSPIRPFQQVFSACNGLDMNYLDKGLAELTGNPADVGVFKSPSLRNIALTAPYMHDGRFKTLEEVVDFYSDNVKPHPNLNPILLHNGDPNLHLTATQKADLVDFLKSLTDNSMYSDDRFANPFK